MSELKWQPTHDEAITIYPPPWPMDSVEALHVALATHGRKRVRRERAIAALVGAVQEAREVFVNGPPEDALGLLTSEEMALFLDGKLEIVWANIPMPGVCRH